MPRASQPEQKCHPERPYGARGFCRTCYVRVWKKENPARAKQLNKESRNRHPETARRARRKFRLMHPEVDAKWEQTRDMTKKIATTRRWQRENAEHVALGVRRRSLMAKFGMSLDEYDVMLAAQGGVCAICGGPNRRALEVDHDHETGAVRGLLCWHCNIGLGMLRDSADIAAKASAYLMTGGPHGGLQGQGTTQVRDGQDEG